jgi:tetratricopeptide (TPR) repeat protein
LNNLGNAALDQDDFLAARGLFEESLAIGRQLGDRYGIAYALDSLANVAFEEGKYPAARALAEESLVIRKELGDKGGMADTLEGLAATFAALGGSLRGARIWGAAERLRVEIGLPLPADERRRYDRRVATARAALTDDAAFDRAWQEGRALTLAEALDLALDESPARA